MKRRNAEGTKPRRLVKRNKITEGIYGSTFLYLKFFLVWILVLMADLFVEFRFEYLWPFWLLIRSVYDSFKYQGLAFSVFFVFIAITSDVVCYLLIPVQWLFFAASTYVWVQYVWHTERGICLPTVSLWLLFVYVEASMRLRDFKSIPSQFQLDLCRPFAAHCIGYPVVTLGFGFKSYVSYRLRLRRQVVVRKENDFYTQLLTQALPMELQNTERQKTQEGWSSGDTETEDSSPGLRRTTLQMINDFLNIALPSKSTEEIISNGVASNSASSGTSSTSASSSSSSPDSKAASTSQATPASNPSAPNPPSSTSSSSSSSQKHKGGHKAASSAAADRDNSSSAVHTEKDLKKHNNTTSTVTTSQTMASSSSGTGDNSASTNLDIEYIERSLHKPNSVNHYEEENLTNEQHAKSYKANGVTKTNKLNSQKDNPASAATTTTTTTTSKKSKANNTAVSYTNNKDEVIGRLESDVKRLKADLQGSRNSEQELRSQINNLSIGDKALKSELYQLRQDNENLQNKLHNLVTSKQQDKQNLGILEKRLQEERKQKAAIETQLVCEKKKRSEECTAATTRALAMAQAARLDCTEACKMRRREMDNEIKQTRRELKLREDQIRQLERETETLRQYQDAQSETEVLMSALQAMQEKNIHLENSLSAETRLKMDLFSALGDAKRQIEIQQGLLVRKEAEINEMKQQVAEVLAVMPSTSNFATTVNPDTNPHFSAPFTTACSSVLVNSTLNPNASDYTPKLNE